MFIWLQVTRLRKERKMKKKKKKKSDFLVPSVPCVNYLFVHMDRLSKCKITCRTQWCRLEDLKRFRFKIFHFCNVLHLWSVRAIPTYRLYRLYDSYSSGTGVYGSKPPECAGIARGQGQFTLPYIPGNRIIYPTSGYKSQSL